MHGWGLESTAAGVQIWLLGRFRASVDGRPVAAEAWRSNRAKALVKLLALAPGHRLHREQLMDTLWPDLGAEAAAANLRKAVHFARHALGADRVRLRDELLSLEVPRLWVDVDAFEAAIEAGDRPAALDLYADDLLIEDRFEPWTGRRRDALRMRLARLLLDWGRELAGGGDGPAAVGVLERLVRLDPLNEEAVVALMRAHADAGERHLALRAYEDLTARLADELGVAPAGEARRYRDELAAGDYRPVAQPVTTGTPAVTEERKLVTALSLDVVPPAVTDPELARAELDRCAEIVADVLESWGAAVERLTGGSVLAVFGVPRIHEDDAGRAIRAALELLDRSPLPPRIGVGTGEVIATGGTGAVRGVVGAAPDAAARLREAAQPGTVLAAERTCRAAGSGFRYGERIEVTPPGGGELVARHVLAGHGDPPGEPRPAAPMVGRDAELAVIRNLFAELTANGQPRLLAVVGPAGIGKTRLVGEAIAVLAADHPDLTTLRGRCLPAGRGPTYGPLAEIVRQACGIVLSDPPELAQAKCRDGLRAILGEQSDPATVLALAGTAGIPFSDDPTPLEPRTLADELARAWPRLVTACATGGPALLLIEDLHWAGRELVELLDLVAARATGPALLLTTARPEVAETGPGPAASREHYASIALRPLTGADSEALLNRLTETSPLPATLRAHVLAKAEGNPFFLEELVLHLREAGEREAGQPGGTELLPDSLHALLSARIDALPAAEKAVLLRAAVVGRTFWDEPVTHALGAAAEPGLRRLERRGFVQRRPTSALTGQVEYGFRHALIHDVAYAAIPKVERARAHAEVGAWLEGPASGRHDEVEELLAYHYASAAATDTAVLAWPEPDTRERIRGRAFGYLLRAGAAARTRSEITAAVDLHERGRALAGTDEEALSAMEELGEDHDVGHHGDAAVEWYGHALVIARGHPDRATDRARLCRKAAWLMASAPGSFRDSPDPADVDRYVAEGRAAATDEVSRAWLLVVRGMSARLWRGSEPFGQGTAPDPVPVEERIRDVEGALAVAESAGLRELVKAARSTLGVLYGIAGRYRQVLDLACRDAEAVDELRSGLEQADVLRTAAVVTLNIAGRLEEGLALARRAYALRAGGTNLHQHMHVTWPVLAALYHLGRWDELLPVLVEHVAAFELEPAIGCQFVRDGAVIGATVAAHRGDLDRARELAAPVGDPLADVDSASAWQARLALATGDAAIARTISEVKSREGRLYGPQHALVLVEALVALRDWPAITAAMPQLRSAIEGNALLGPHCDRAEGLVQTAAGNDGAARELLRRALSGFERMRVPFEAARTRERLAAVEPAAAADDLLTAARATYRRLGVAVSQVAGSA